MDGYEHYIRIDQAGTIVYGFSSAFEEPQDGDICIIEDGPRHFNQIYPSLTNERSQYRFKWDGRVVERSQQELDAEWVERPRPVEPLSEVDQLKAQNAEIILTLVINDLM
jgi:hypothetical protein